MKLLILLDFDGVLFNSAYEAYRVCERATRGNSTYRQGISFEEFMEFRRYLIDAWQFNRLYSKSLHLRDYSSLAELAPCDEDWEFTKKFFEVRSEMLVDPEWPKLMSPYNFFFEIKHLLVQHPNLFKILSTRNEESIRKTLEFNSVKNLEIYGQEQMRKHGSKLGVAEARGWIGNDFYTVYVDDMVSHLEPFEQQADLCFHAGWGYDASHYESVTQAQMYKVIKGLVSMANQEKS